LGILAIQGREMRKSALAFLVLFVSGCASARLTVVEPLGAPVRDLSLQVTPMSTAPMTEQQQSQLRTLLTTSLAGKGVTVRSKANGTSALDGEIHLYDPGNRALRYLVGFGAGSGYFGSTWKVVDGSGQEIGSCRVEGSIRMGVFGGSYDDVLDRVGERLGEFVTGVEP
jgi:hypothetical protein